MRLAHPKLQEFTNKFIESFFELAYALDSEKDPKAQRDDSYRFNYALPECIIYSDYFQNKETDMMSPLLDMGFVQNIVNGFFETNIKKIKFNKKMKLVLDNFNSQDEYSDWRFEDLIIESKQFISNDINPEAISNILNIPFMIDVEKTRTTYAFKVSSYKSGYKGICKVNYVNNELEETILLGEDDKSIYLTIDDREECRIHHYSNCSDINGFFNVFSQVLYDIENPEG